MVNIRQHIYRNVEYDEFYMVKLTFNNKEKDELLKISEHISKDLKTWELMGKPYTKESLKNGFKNLEQVYEYMDNNNKLPIYDIKDESYGDKLY